VNREWRRDRYAATFAQIANAVTFQLAGNATSSWAAATHVVPAVGELPTIPISFGQPPSKTYAPPPMTFFPAGQVAVTSLRPDLVISALSRFSVTISNRGGAIAGPSLLTITNVGTFKVPSIAPGASVVFSWSTCRVATYTAVADARQAVAELDEKNNTATLRNTCSRS
jgi:CARDB